MKKLFTLFALLALLLTGCSMAYDDSEIVGRLDELEEDVDKLREEIEASKVLLNALANNLTITSVSETEEGYIITFSDNSSIIVHHGKDGEQGVQGEKGEQGDKGDKGEQGDKGDKGEDGADGEDGDNLIASITINEDSVTFVLTNGQSVTIALNGGGSGSGQEPDDKPSVSDTPLADMACAPNEILYTTKYDLPIELGNTQGFGGNLVYNTYENGIGRLTFGNDVTAIPASAFKDCNSMEYIKLPDDITSVSRTAFRGCTSLIGFCGKSASEDGKCLIFDNKLVAFAPGLTEYIIPDCVTSIEECAFCECSRLVSIIIPDKVTEIGYCAFSDCTSLTNVVVGEGVTKIDAGAFQNCISLAKINIPNSVTSIGTYAFLYCTGELTIDNKWLIEHNTYLAQTSGFDRVNFSSIVIGENITKIGNDVFSGFSSLTSVTIPDSVTEIGHGAFNGCSSLTSVHITDVAAWCGITFVNYSANPLYYAHNLYLNGELVTDLVIPDGVTSIGYRAFYECDSLTSITIPDSVTEIGFSSFDGCSSLTSVTIPDSVTLIVERAFYNCTSLTEVYCMPTTPPLGGSYIFSYYNYNHNRHQPIGCKIYVPTESVEAYKTAQYWSEYAADIVGYDFGGGENTTTPPANEIWYTNGSTTKPTTPNKTDVFGATYVSNTYDAEKGCWVIKFDGDVTSIGYEAFRDCTSLISITIPDSVTEIEVGAFEGCTSLTSITIPDSVTSIGEDAFRYCTSLTSITIPDSVTEIGDYAFYGCSSLTSVHITDVAAWCGITFVSYYYANPLYYAHNLYLNGELVTDLVIPDGVTEIGNYAFSGCTSLTSVTIGNGVTKIGGSVFWCCTSLTSITIPDSVTDIGDYACSGCSLLTSITIPDSVTSIGSGAFRYCTSLTRFHGKFASSDNRCLIIDGVLNSFAPAGLTSYTIPDSVTSIGEEAFYGCSSLTSVTIPDGVTLIDWGAFLNCTSLKEVYCKVTTPPRGSYYMFLYYNNYTYRPIGCKIYVPTESVEAYKTAENWSEYAADIVGYDF